MLTIALRGHTGEAPAVPIRHLLDPSLYGETRSQALYIPLKRRRQRFVEIIDIEDRRPFRCRVGAEIRQMTIAARLHAQTSSRAGSEIGTAKLRRKLEKRLDTILAAGAKHFGLVEEHSGGWRIKDKPPLVRHLSRHELHARKAFASYAETLQEDRRVLLHRYHLRDVAFKVVGVGSVGTFCAIGLFVSDDGSPLLLQIKEAQASVLAPFAGASDYANHGQRVVVGQRMMQAAPDVFLGWTQTPVDGRHFYVRRLKDARLGDVGDILEGALPYYAKLCGNTLARAHVRSGDAIVLSGYMGDDSDFDKAIAEFAMAYADQTEHDWRAFLDAIKAGRIAAEEPHAPAA